MSKVNREFTASQRPTGKEIRVCRVSPMMHTHVNNIADHLGISVTDLMKAELLKIISSYPKEYLQPIIKD